MIRLISILAALSCLLVNACSNDTGTTEAFTLAERPAQEELLFDYAGTFRNIEESTRRYLHTLKNSYGIETCIVTLTSSPDQQPIQQLAATLFSNWNIGRDYGGRGLLFLFIDSAKEVKFEVAYELEDVFTDAFTGYIEDLQLRPNYRSGDLEVGIIAVFEEVEKRAERKKLGDYTEESIAASDAALLSGGGGAGKDLSAYKESSSVQEPDGDNIFSTRSTAAKTPGQAFEIMLSKWAGNNTHPEVDIYTEATKMAMGDQNKPADKRVATQARSLLGVPFTVKQDNNVALIHFNRDKGWQYAPYLFANDGSGWKFDIASQRKYVVFGSKDSWHLERGDHPYNGLFSGLRNGLRKDLPSADDVTYRIADDKTIANKIRQLEQQSASSRGLDNGAALEVGRLGVVTARRPQHVFTPLNRVKKNAPDMPDTYRYLAVYHVMSNFQYESALQEITTYNGMTKTVYGLNVQGFLEYKTGQYAKAAETFRQAVQLEPSLYGWCKLSRTEAMLYQTSAKIDPRRSAYRTKAIEAYNAARELAPDNWRVAMLERWLRHKNLLPDI